MRALILLVLILPVLSFADTSSTTVAVFIAECTDGIDNDGDAIIDYPLDAGCTGYGDDDETDPSFLCSDGLDNDGDALIDFPSDPGCDSATDQTENNIPTSAANPASYGGTVTGLIQLFRPVLAPVVTLPPAQVSAPDTATPVQTPDGPIPVHTPPARRVVGPLAPASGTSTIVREEVRVGVFDGVVTDSDQRPVLRAEVRLFSRLPDGTLVPVEVGGGAQVARLTNTSGYYKLDPVPEGDYSIVVTAAGYKPYTGAAIMETRQDVVLEKASATDILLSFAQDAVLTIPLCGPASACANPSWVPFVALILLIIIQISFVRLFLHG